MSFEKIGAATAGFLRPRNFSVSMALLSSLLSGYSQAENCVDMPVSGKTYHIVNEGSGLYLDVDGASTENGANIHQWGENSFSNQDYTVTDLGGGYWSIRPVHSGKSLDVFDWSTQDGGTIKQWDYWGGEVQQWQLTQTTSGAIKIASRYSGKLVTVADNSQGSDVYQNADLSSAYQHWFFNPTDGTCSSDTSVTLSGSAGVSKVDLNWSEPPPIKNLQVYRDTDSNPSGRVRIAGLDVSARSYTDDTAAGGSTYWYWVKYRTLDDVWHDSNAFSATPTSPASEVTEGTVVDSAAELLSAIDTAQPGDVIYLRGGTYAFFDTIELLANGTESSPITLSKYPSDSQRPLLDFSAMSESSSNRGMELRGNHWYIYGIDAKKAGDNCLFISGSDNIVEFSTFSECADTGLQLGNGASNNLIKNVDSYFNADASLENADGFAAKLDVGSGNQFVGCRAWNNLDDGFDGYLRGTDNITTTYKNTWAIRNGYDRFNNAVTGDGNGFKTGGSDDKTLRHNAIFINTIAAGNRVDGYDHNSNRGDVTIHSAIAHNNGRNINFGSSNQANKLTIKNTVSLGQSGSLNASTTDITHNSWQNGVSATAADFISIDIDELLAPRQADGSLPEVNYFRLQSNSDLIDAGTDVGLPYNGSAPDIGAFEAN